MASPVSPQTPALYDFYAQASKELENLGRDGRRRAHGQSSPQKAEFFLEMSEHDQMGQSILHPQQCRDLVPESFASAMRWPIFMEIPKASF